MCGRFLNALPVSELGRLFGIPSGALPNWPARYNIAPSQKAPVVRFNPEDGRRHLDLLRWGLIPFWARDAKIGYRTINAMAEAVATKPAFREAFKSRRCLIPAGGFYEWQKRDIKTKQPYAVVPADGPLFAFAGLWERWTDPATQEIVRSFTIITSPPNALVAPIHNRTPVILDESAWGVWLGEVRAERDALLGLLTPFPAERMRAYPIGAQVGNVRNDHAGLLDAVG